VSDYLARERREDVAPADGAGRVPVVQPLVNAVLVEHVQARRQPSHHLALLHLAEAHRAVRRASVPLLVRRDVGGGDHPRYADDDDRALPRKHADAMACCLVAMYRMLWQSMIGAAASPQAAPDGVERRGQAPPQRRPGEDIAAEDGVDAGADAEPEDEEDGEHDDPDPAVPGPRLPDDRVDEEARAADAHRVGDGQTVQPEAPVHGER
jgi:hypothetical protein